MKARKAAAPRGLKAMSQWRKEPNKGYIPRDNDGAYRVERRLDGLTIPELLRLATERAG